MLSLDLIVALVIAVLAVVFALQNSMLVTISFFNSTVSGSLSLVLLATLAIGVLIGLLVLASSLFRKTFKTSSQHKTNVAELQNPTVNALVARHSAIVIIAESGGDEG
jgi:lipopolysaccharide assembly protein A